MLSYTTQLDQLLEMLGLNQKLGLPSFVFLPLSVSVFSAVVLSSPQSLIYYRLEVGEAGGKL